MEHLDEQEMLIQFSEMTAFDFNSEEFQKVRKDYIECKNSSARQTVSEAVYGRRVTWDFSCITRKYR